MRVNPSWVMEVHPAISGLWATGGYGAHALTLIVPAEDDSVVPVGEADLIHKAWFDSQLLRLPAGGHQRLLSDPLLLQAVLELLEQVPQASLKAMAS